MKFAFIRDLDEEERRKPRKARIPVSLMCEVLKVSRSGFYAWLQRDRSDREKEDTELSGVIKKIHEDHKGRLGVDRLVAELAKLGRRHSPRRVRRLARAAGLTCVHPRPYRATTIQDGANSDGLVDLVGREFVPAGPNQLWFTDITYIRTWGGWAYLAAIIDGYSRKIVGWSVDSHMRTTLVTDALRMAIERQRPGIGDVVIHSDYAEVFVKPRMCVFRLPGVVVALISRLNVSWLSQTVERLELVFGERLGGRGVDCGCGGVDGLSHHVQCCEGVERCCGGGVFVTKETHDDR